MPISEPAKPTNNTGKIRASGWPKKGQKNEVLVVLVFLSGPKWELDSH